MKKIRLGTRGSALALWQANHVATLIKQSWSDIDTEIIPIKTTGDIRQDVSLAKIGGKGLFIKEIEQALLEGEIDCAVHSMKDMPAKLPEALSIQCILKREDPRDALVSHDGLSFKRIADNLHG